MNKKFQLKFLWFVCLQIRVLQSPILISLRLYLKSGPNGFLIATRNSTKNKTEGTSSGAQERT